ncbi:cytidine deaminase [bacterium]|nr:MAG: cytidine deaminase [bacterium]
MDERDRELVAAAAAIRDRAHAPYSDFRVGAALRDARGDVHLGVNVENISFGLSVCAERHAVAAAVAAGERELEAIAICGGDRQPTPPCGACRQVLREFGPELRIIMAGRDGVDGPVEITTLAVLMPGAFTDFNGETTG